MTWACIHTLKHKRTRRSCPGNERASRGEHRGSGVQFIRCPQLLLDDVKVTYIWSSAPPVDSVTFIRGHLKTDKEKCQNKCPLWDQFNCMYIINVANMISCCILHMLHYFCLTACSMLAIPPHVLMKTNFSLSRRCCWGSFVMFWTGHCCSSTSSRAPGKPLWFTYIYTNIH